MQAVDGFREPTVLLVDEVGGDQDIPQVLTPHRRPTNQPGCDITTSSRCPRAVPSVCAVTTTHVS